MCFCTEVKVARQLQIYRGLFPVVPLNMQGASVEDIPEVSKEHREASTLETGHVTTGSSHLVMTSRP